MNSARMCFWCWDSISIYDCFSIDVVHPKGTDNFIVCDKCVPLFIEGNIRNKLDFYIGHRDKDGLGTSTSSN